MSKQYNDYLKMHKDNVTKAFYWIKQYLPELTKGDSDLERQITLYHDSSKSSTLEYIAYDDYFYGSDNGSIGIVKKKFDVAWLTHIHRNPHHWQHWVLINDDHLLEETLIDMPYEFILEMVCDWWSFGLKIDKPHELFKFYHDNQRYMKLSTNTRVTLEDILSQIKEELKKQGVINNEK